MEIYKSEYIRLDHDGEKSLIFCKWSDKTAKISENYFLKEVTTIVDNIVKWKVKYFLVDEREFKFVTSNELQVVIAKNVLSKISNCGLLRFAHVSSKDFMAHLAVELTFQEDPLKSYKERFFDDLEDARTWVLA